MSNWSKPFIPNKTGQGPEGVSIETHEIERRYYIDYPWMSVEYPCTWDQGWFYRYRPHGIVVTDQFTHRWGPAQRMTTTATTPSGADGSAYYDLTIKGVTISCNDVIDALGLNFNSGNEFKAIWRDGRKQGVDRRYDLEKRVYFAKRELENHNND